MTTQTALLMLDTGFLEGMGFWAWIAVIVVVGSITSAIAGVIKHTATERTRREIAAYIAEGTMTPEQGERLLTATGRSSDCDD